MQKRYIYAMKKTKKHLILQENKTKFKADNIKIVDLLPRLSQLPPATHVFIGGTSGNIMEIISCLEKNPNTKL